MLEINARLNILILVWFIILFLFLYLVYYFISFIFTHITMCHIQVTPIINFVFSIFFSQRFRFSIIKINCIFLRRTRHHSFLVSPIYEKRLENPCFFNFLFIFHQIKRESVFQRKFQKKIYYSQNICSFFLMLFY